MNPNQRLLPPQRPRHGAESSVWAHALIWVLLVVAALLLAGFTAVVNDITERGELRRAQHRASGTSLPMDGLQTRGVVMERLLSITREKPAGR